MSNMFSLRSLGRLLSPAPAHDDTSFNLSRPLRELLAAYGSSSHETLRHEDVYSPAPDQTFNINPTYSVPLDAQDILTTYSIKELYEDYTNQNLPLILIRFPVKQNIFHVMSLPDTQENFDSTFGENTCNLLTREPWGDGKNIYFYMVPEQNNHTTCLKTDYLGTLADLKAYQSLGIEKKDHPGYVLSLYIDDIYQRPQEDIHQQQLEDNNPGPIRSTNRLMTWARSIENYMRSRYLHQSQT